jgi:ferredoxin
MPVLDQDPCAASRQYAGSVPDVFTTDEDGVAVVHARPNTSGSKSATPPGAPEIMEWGTGES